MWVATLVIWSIPLLSTGAVAAACNNEDCQSLSDIIKNSMDPTEKPCNNFYAYACGNFLKKTYIPPDQESISVVSQIAERIENTLTNELEAKTLEGQPRLFQMAKDLYNSCMNTDEVNVRALTDLKSRIVKYGRWPVIDKLWRDCSFDWFNVTKKLAVAGEEYGHIIDVQFDFNNKNTSQTIILLQNPPLGLDRVYLLEGKDNEVVKAYLEVMVAIAVEMGADRERAQKELTESLQFEIDLAKISQIDPVEPEYQSLVKNVKISDLRNEYPDIDLVLLIRSVLEQFNVTVGEGDAVEVFNPSYLKKLAPLLAITDKRTIENYLMWQVIFTNRRYLTSRVDQIIQKLRSVLFGTKTLPTRKDLCLDVLTVTFEHEITPIVASMYVKKYFKKNSKHQAMKIVDPVKKQFLKVLSEVTWMDSKTRHRLVDKVAHTLVTVGYPNELTNERLLENYFKTLKIDKDEFAKNILNMRRFRRYNQIKRINKGFKIRGWEHQEIAQVIYPGIVNHLAANAIDMFAGVLQGVYFAEQRPLFVNVATIADLLGNVFTYSVDLVGSQFDKHGNVATLWSDQTKSQYKKKLESVVDEFSKYIVKQVNMPINGSLVAGEILAQRAGMKTAYLALEQVLASSPGDNTIIGFEDYPARKLFWLVNAVSSCEKYRDEYLKNVILKNPVAPAEVFVNEVYRNNPKFSEDWGCLEGSYMNAKNKDQVW